MMDTLGPFETTASFMVDTALTWEEMLESLLVADEDMRDKAASIDIGRIGNGSVGR